MKKNWTLISLLLLWASSTMVYAQDDGEKVLIKTVLDTTFRIGMFGNFEIPYTFAQDDEILFSFTEQNGNELSLLQIQEPSAELNMQAKNVITIEDKFINISEKGEHILLFKQNPYFGISTFKKRDCQVKIKKIIPVKDFVVIDTSYIPQPRKLVKVDSTYQTFLDTMVYVASELNVNNSDRTSIPVFFPPETTYWSYWIGADKVAINNYNSYEKLVVEDWQEAKISSAMEAYTLGNITYFPVNLQGETTSYFFTDEGNKNRFEQKQTYTKFSNIKNGQQIRADYAKMQKSGIADTMYMCFLNKNNVSGVNVYLKMAALKLKYEYEEQEDSMVITKKALTINTDAMSIEAAKDSVEQLKKDMIDAAKKVEEEYKADLAKLDSTKAGKLSQLDQTQKSLDAEEKRLEERDAALTQETATPKEDYIKEVFALRDKLSKAEKELESLKGGDKGKKKKGGKTQKPAKGKNKGIININKGEINNIYIGGDIGFSFTQRAFDLRLSPFIAYYLIPKVSLAVGPRVEYHKDLDKEGVLTYGGRAFVRGDISQNIFVHAEIEAMSRLGSGDSATRKWDLGLPVGGGYRQKIGQNAYFNVTLLFDVLNPKATNNRSPFSYRGGVTYDFGKVGKKNISKMKAPKLPDAPKLPSAPKIKAPKLPKGL
ncbi:MAG: hypothetical protein ACPGVB_00350 [Chitinophagales bacterium]